MKSIKCDQCGKVFERKISQVLLARRHFCSVVCQNNAKKLGKIIPCFVCGKKVYKKKKDIEASKGKKFFCGVTCSNMWLGSQRHGEQHPNWVNGRFAYKNILGRTNQKKECRLCKESDTRILSVHHIDKNRANNLARNLVWLCYNCHFLVHHDIGEMDKLIRLTNLYGNK